MINPVDFKGKSGVYRIVQPDGRFYIGSSMNIYGRLRGHKCILNGKSVHKIEYTYSWDELSIDILEYVTDKNIIKDIEKSYIEKLWCENILNNQKEVRGRDILGDKNPMKNKESVDKVREHLKNQTGDKNPCWRGGLVKIKTTCPICGGKKQYESKRCMTCRKNKRII